MKTAFITAIFSVAVSCLFSACQNVAVNYKIVSSHAGPHNDHHLVIMREWPKEGFVQLDLLSKVEVRSDPENDTDAPVTLWEFDASSNGGVANASLDVRKFPNRGEIRIKLLRAGIEREYVFDHLPRTPKEALGRQKVESQ